MYCIFCPASDLAALWAYQGLRQRGLAALEIFTIEALAYNQRFQHRLRADETHTIIKLVDGRVLDSAAVRGALNRLSYLPSGHFLAASQADQNYAAQEQQAVFLSWLSALPGPLINCPSPRGLGGDGRSAAEWAWLAGKAGLPVQPYFQGDVVTTNNVAPGLRQATIVLDGELFGLQNREVSQSFRVSCSRLAELAGVRLLGIEFYILPHGEGSFACATPLPDLRLGGEGLLEALGGALMGAR